MLVLGSKIICATQGIKEIVKRNMASVRFQIIEFIQLVFIFSKEEKKERE